MFGFVADVVLSSCDASEVILMVPSSSHRTHFRKAEALVTLPEAEAREATLRCRAAARDRGLPVAFWLLCA